jgi:hypothetical protein
MERKRRCQRGPLLHCPVMWRTQHAAVHGSATPQTPHPAPIIRRQRPRTYVTPTQLRLPAPTGYAGTPATPAGRVSARTTRCRPVQPSASQRHRRWRRHGTEGRSRERHAHTHTHTLATQYRCNTPVSTARQTAVQQAETDRSGRRRPASMCSVRAILRWPDGAIRQCTRSLPVVRARIHPGLHSLIAIDLPHSNRGVWYDAYPKVSRVGRLDAVHVAPT